MRSLTLQNHPRHRWLEMRERKCDISGARKNSKAMLISKSDVRTRTTQGVNLQWKKLWWEEGNKYVHVRIAARTLKTIRLKGLDATAKRYGVDLNKFSISYGSKAAATAAHSDGDAAKRQEVAASKAA